MQTWLQGCAQVIHSHFDTAGNAITFSSSCFGGKIEQDPSASSLEIALWTK
jgi:hypothetical protein